MVKVPPLIFFLVSCPWFFSWGTSCDHFLELASKINRVKSISLENGNSLPVYRGLSGKPFVFLFPFERTPIELIEGEPYVWVYRGLRGKLRIDQASGTIDDISFTESIPQGKHLDPGIFGDQIFTTLKPNVAIDYLTRSISMRTPKNLTLVAMRLPLKLAYVAKVNKNISTGENLIREDLLRALENRLYIWLKWRAPQRRKERELVWLLRELGGTLNPSSFLIRTIEVPVEPTRDGFYESYSNWHLAQQVLRQRFNKGDWD